MAKMEDIVVNLDLSNLKKSLSDLLTQIVGVLDGEDADETADVDDVLNHKYRFVFTRSAEFSVAELLDLGVLDEDRAVPTTAHQLVEAINTMYPTSDVDAELWFALGDIMWDTPNAIRWEVSKTHPSTHTGIPVGSDIRRWFSAGFTPRP